MKILFVAMHNSIHTARWISQLSQTGWDIGIFVVNDWESPHPDIKNSTLYYMEKQNDQEVSETVKLKYLFPYVRNSRWYKIKSKFCPRIKERGYWLAQAIKDFKPDIIHSMEMQHAAYLTYQAKKLYRGKFPPWIYSCWGSDIYYFQQFADHQRQIREVLNSCNYLFADCSRDVDLAREYGFKGELLGVHPGVGGFKIDEMRSLSPVLPASRRKIITVKGYTGWVYRPMTIIRGLNKCKEQLKGYTLVVYGPTEETIRAAEDVCEKCGMKLEVIRYAPHSEMIKLFGASRVSLASSVSDGTPNSMLEAMTMGAYPIQSDTVSTAEWLENGVNGNLVHPEDSDGFAKALMVALTNDDLVDKAAKYNLDMLRNRIEYAKVQPKVVKAYKNVYSKNKSFWQKMFRSGSD